MSLEQEHMNLEESYALLELRPGASREVIKAAYKALAKKYHPDIRCPGEDRSHFEEKMSRLNQAHSLLLAELGNSSRAPKEAPESKRSTNPRNSIDLLEKIRWAPDRAVSERLQYWWPCWVIVPISAVYGYGVITGNIEYPEFSAINLIMGVFLIACWALVINTSFLSRTARQVKKDPTSSELFKRIDDKFGFDKIRKRLEYDDPIYEGERLFVGRELIADFSYSSFFIRETSEIKDITLSAQNTRRPLSQSVNLNILVLISFPDDNITSLSFDSEQAFQDFIREVQSVCPGIEVAGS